MGKRLLIIALAFGLGACTDSGIEKPDPLPALPKVFATVNNYQESDIRQRVPDKSLHDAFKAAYAGAYSNALKAELVDYIIAEAQRLRIDTTQLRDCLAATGRLDEHAVALPYLAEHARYDSTAAWIFEFAWGYEGDDELGHHCCFVMDRAEQDTLLFITCR